MDSVLQEKQFITRDTTISIASRSRTAACKTKCVDKMLYIVEHRAIKSLCHTYLLNETQLEVALRANDAKSNNCRSGSQHHAVFPYLDMCSNIVLQVALPDICIGFDARRFTHEKISVIDNESSPYASRAVLGL